MWLINTTNLRLEKFQECPAKSYAILSHTWGTDAEELDFEEFRGGGGRGKAGFEKIRLCCKEAKRNAIQYAWVDTCCIDKRSSTELSEAINSMFAWYAKSKICYVYLADISFHDSVAQLTHGDRDGVLDTSRWFTRGWTLQELIAPESLTFFAKEWTKIGNKVSLAAEIHNITGIDVDVLRQRKSFLDCSVAQRMSWASLRHTTRLEDNAYCLLGLFDVNLPLMYGEGERAFLRLQKQIIEHTDDETIFAWHNVPSDGSGLLAPNVAHFASTAGIEAFRAGGNCDERPPYFSTNKGLSFECRLIPYAMNTYLVPLNCHFGHQQVSIFLTKPVDSNQFLRTSYEGESVFLNELSLTDGRIGRTKKQRMRKIFIANDGYGLHLGPHGGFPLLRIKTHLSIFDVNLVNQPLYWRGQHGDHGREAVVGAGLISCISPRSRQIQFRRKELTQGVLIAFEPSILEVLLLTYSCLHLGFDEDFKPACSLYTHTGLFPLALLTGSAQEKFSSILDGIPMSPRAKAKGDHVRYDGLGGGGLILPISFCHYIEVYFEPLDELAFNLTISEKRRHRRSTIRFCLRCLRNNSVDKIERLMRSASLVLPDDTITVCFLCITCPILLLLAVFGTFHLFQMLATVLFRWAVHLCLIFLQ